MKTSSVLVFLTAALFSIAPLSAFAADVETGKIISVPATQAVSDNVYLAGGEVVFLANAEKDLTAAGGQILINGPVSGDVLAVGGSVQVLQPVKGSVRVAGGQVTIGNNVAGDVLAAGGTVIILPGAVVSGDVIVAGGAVDIEGAVNGSIRAYGGNVTINGAVAGPVSIHAGKQVTFGDKAVIGSTLVYAAPQEAAVASGAKLGDQVTFTKNGALSGMEGGRAAAAFWGILGFLVFAKFVAMLVAALVLVLAFKEFTQTRVEKTLAYFWKKVLIGFVALVAIPAAAVVLFITLIGAYLGIALILSYLLALFAAGVYMCVFTGALLSHWIRKEAVADWKWTILGALVVFFIAFVPFIGWIADLLLFLASLGTVVMALKRAS
jgi:hypothetical protein